MKFLTLILSMILCSLAHASSDSFCSIYPANENDTTFYCLNSKEKLMSAHNVANLFERSYTEQLKEEGVKFIEPAEFAVRAREVGAKVVRNAGVLSWCEQCDEVDFQKVAHEVNEFNRLSPTGKMVANVKQLAEILHKVGVCELPIHKNNFNINNSDTLLLHFLCISDEESVFGSGEGNFGAGGRGPWGINPIHTLSDGICKGTKATLRNSKGENVGKNSPKEEKSRFIAMYESYEVRLANGKCAMDIYKSKKTLNDWGTKTTSWGSNKKCINKRSKMDFGKYLGELSCCSASCKNKYSNLKEI